MSLTTTFRRSSIHPRSAPTIKMALALYALTIVLMMSYCMAMYLFMNAAVLDYLVLSEPIAQWAFIFFPVMAILWYRRIDFGETLSLRRPSMIRISGAILIAVGMSVVLHQLFAWQTRIVPIPEELDALVSKVHVIANSPMGFIILLVAFAVSPAVCEELLYRGVLVSSLRQRMSPVTVSLLVGVLFALYHLHPYRFPLIFVLGVVLTYVVLRSGSIYLCMLTHFIHNTINLILTAELQDKWLTFIRYSQEHGFTTDILITALLFLVVGIIAMEKSACGQRGEAPA